LPIFLILKNPDEIFWEVILKNSVDAYWEKKHHGKLMWCKVKKT